MNLESIERVETYIKSDIFQSFSKIEPKEIEPMNRNDQFFNYKKRIFVTQNNSNLSHCVICKKFSEAGNHYNNSTLTFLRETIKNSLQMKKLNLEEELYSFIVKNQKNLFLNEEISFKKRKIDENTVEFFHENNNKKDKILLKTPILNYFGYVTFSSNDNDKKNTL